jgi:hypothetical protein
MPAVLTKPETATPEKLGWAGEHESKYLELDCFLPAPRSNWKAKGRPSTSTPQDQELEAKKNAELTSVMAHVEIDPLIRLTGAQGTIRRFKVLQQFECVVTELLEDAVVAELIDLTDPSRPNEIAEIPLTDIPSADHSLLAPGCVFYWILGFETTVGGQRNRVSEIRVRRTPKWSENEIEAIKAEGEGLFRQFSSGSEDKTS